MRLTARKKRLKGLRLGIFSQERLKAAFLPKEASCQLELEYLLQWRHRVLFLHLVSSHLQLITVAALNLGRLFHDIATWPDRLNGIGLHRHVAAFCQPLTELYPHHEYMPLCIR